MPLSGECRCPLWRFGIFVDIMVCGLEIGMVVVVRLHKVAGCEAGKALGWGTPANFKRLVTPQPYSQVQLRDQREGT